MSEEKTGQPMAEALYLLDRFAEKQLPRVFHDRQTSGRPWRFAKGLSGLKREGWTLCRAEGRGRGAVNRH